MSIPESSAPTLDRRAFLAVTAGAAAGLLVLRPTVAQAQAPSPGQAATAPLAEQPPTTLSARESAEIEKLRAETEAIQAANSTIGQIKEGVKTTGGFIVTAVGAWAALKQWRHGKEAQAAADARQAELDRYAELRDIGDLLNQSGNPDGLHQGAEQLSLIMLERPSLTDQEHVFKLARGALRRRPWPTQGPVRLSDYEHNLIDAFITALPIVHQAGTQRKKAFVGPAEDMEDNTNVQGINLAGAQLFGCDLRKVHMSRSCLREARFNNATLGPTNLNGCDLRGAIFIHMSNTETDFGQVWLQNSDLRQAIIRTHYLENPQFYKQIAQRAAAIEGLILLGDTTLNHADIKVLTDRGAIYVPKDHPDYQKYYDHTRTPTPPSLDSPTPAASTNQS